MLIALKLKAALMGAAIVAPVLAASLGASTAPSVVDGAVTLAPASFAYRVAGDFSQGGRPVASPLREMRLPRGLSIMKSQVTAGEYARCVAEASCPHVPLPEGSRDVPVVGVNWNDASAYAAWISGKTGVTHRLPTDEEWSFAAAEKARDEALPLVDPADPAQAWIARYDAEAARGRPAVVGPQPVGAFGPNSKGLVDVGGNVWEWTQTCFVRASLDQGTERVTNTNCGVRVVQGAHRTYMTDFIRDPRTGGCAAGVPPANLGFRLVVDRDGSYPMALLKEALLFLRLG
jgi:formylglycine-generating enzyme required for sulfatase activity